MMKIIVRSDSTLSTIIVAREPEVEVEKGEIFTLG